MKIVTYAEDADWLACPNCSQYEGVNAGGFDVSADRIHQDIWCTKCGFEWIEVWQPLQREIEVEQREEVFK